jgi:hypothetical protein
MVAKRSTISDALKDGNRTALELLCAQLASQIDSCTTARDRLPLVRAFLASVSALETLEAQAYRRVRDEARSASGEPLRPSNPVDELLTRRARRYGHL